MSRTTIFQSIDHERHRQDAKWGEQNHSPEKWCLILGEEFGEVMREGLEIVNNFKPGMSFLDEKITRLLNYKKELIQTAAVCVSMLESLERNELKDYNGKK